MPSSKRQIVKVGASAPIEVKSSQPPEEDLWTPEEAVTPPADLEALAKLTQQSRTRRSCIAAIVTNTVGLGVGVEPVKGKEADKPEQEPEEVLDALDELAGQDDRSGNPTFKSLVERVKWDEQEVGNGYIEVARNKTTGEINALFHVPGKRVRRRQDRDGWVMGPNPSNALTLGQKRTLFYRFGKKVKYDSEGKPLSTLNGPGMKWDINELIPLQLYTSESRDYGLPPDAQLLTDYLADSRAADTNLAFFDSSGVPPSVLFVKVPIPTGDADEIELEIDPALAQRIADLLKPTLGSRSRVAIVPLPEGVEVQREDLAIMSERDMGYIEFRRDNRRATLGAWRLAPIFVADIEDTNYSTAEIEKTISKEQVFDPEQERTASLLTRALLREIAPEYEFNFAEIDVNSGQENRTSANDAADRGAITHGEYRERHGLPRLPEADEVKDPENTIPEDPKPGEVEFGWNDELFDSKGGGPIPPGLEPYTGDPNADPNAPPPDPNAAAAVGDSANGGNIVKGFEQEIAEDFHTAVADAINMLRETDDGFEVKPVQVSKNAEGDIIVEPYEGATEGA